MKYKLDISHVVAFDNDRLIEGAKPLSTKFEGIEQSPMIAIVYFMDYATELFEKYEHMIELVAAGQRQRVCYKTNTYS